MIGDRDADKKQLLPDLPVKIDHLGLEWHPGRLVHPQLVSEAITVPGPNRKHKRLAIHLNDGSQHDVFVVLPDLIGVLWDRRAKRPPIFSSFDENSFLIRKYASRFFIITDDFTTWSVE